MKLKPKKWETFQHYKDRNPPWIKLHKELLDDFDWWGLPVASRALAPCLWLLASRYEDGIFDATPERLAFQFRMTVKDVVDAINPLIDKDYFHIASNTLAGCKQLAMPETETETETEISCVRFDEFWSAYPDVRKQGKKPCREKWIKKRLDAIADQIIADVIDKRDGWGKFAPAPLTYINQERWNDGDQVDDQFAGVI